MAETNVRRLTMLSDIPEWRSEILDVENSAPIDEFLASQEPGIRLVPQPADDQGTLALQPDGIDFAKWLRRHHSSLRVDVPKAPRRILHSHDIWIPLAFLAKDVGLPFFLSLVANYVYDKTKGALKGSTSQVHVSAEYFDGESGTVKRFEFEGSPEALEKVVKKFDPNKFMNGK